MAGVVTTIKAKCKRCYTCVRSCPAKAIKVEDGQAQVIEERCIACGFCYMVCAQQAKRIQYAIDRVYDMLKDDRPVVALLAPSFPALFPHARPEQVVAAVRALGFDEVLEVAFGAELVAREYARLFRQSDSLIISSPCPAITTYVQKYVPSLVPYLAPVVSPAVALGRLVKQRYRPVAHTVFIGPCVAKKAEIADPNVVGAVDVALSFAGLKRMLRTMGVVPEEQPDSDFDGPRAGLACAFPVPGGLLKAAALEADLLDNDILVTEGRDEAIACLRALEKGELSARFVDILFCRGCIEGPTLDGETSTFARKEAVASFARGRARSAADITTDLDTYSSLDLTRRFTIPPVGRSHPSDEEIAEILGRIGKSERGAQLNCGACGYHTCREKAIAVHEGLAEAEMCLPYLIETLQSSLAQLEEYQRELQETQVQLVHTEKLASMGQLAAGIAHELNNPLGTILIYAHLLMQNVGEGSVQRADLETILEETSRCKNIVAGLLDFARQRKVLAQVTDLNAVLAESLTRVARRPEFAHVLIVRRLDPRLPRILADPNQLREVFGNLLVNAADAMPNGGTLTVRSRLGADGASVVVEFADTGQGIDEDGLKRIFTPFFTTKPRGTGLGLAIAHGIIKMHRGNITAASRSGEGAKFTITLPLRVRADEEPEPECLEEADVG